MKYLLDTNTCIKYLNGTSDKIKNKFVEYSFTEMFLCSVVKSELIFGAHKSGNPVKNLKKMNLFFEPFISLPFDDNCANIYGVIRSTLEKKGTPIGPNDLLIASIALSYKLILVTHNIREFKRVPNLNIEDWE
ncbi:MAG TPA: type II toxin-antitoxin system VapC family toxin [Ignavibacteria bacterium]|nr:type II toxin-antitoxin system VapC family toxin [Ignavibacteria bacterium]